MGIRARWGRRQPSGRAPRPASACRSDRGGRNGGFALLDGFTTDHSGLTSVARVLDALDPSRTDTTSLSPRHNGRRWR